MKNMKKEEKEIPTHDPFTGELNPYYEELTGKKNPLRMNTTNKRQMKTEEFNKIIDEVYNHYLETHQYEPFILQEEMDLSKEDFIKKVTNNYGFGQLFGISLNERELTASERISYKNTKEINFLDSNELFDFIKSNVTIDLDNETHKECDKYNIPTKVITLFYKGEETQYYK